jgi:hypothetical protein
MLLLLLLQHTSRSWEHWHTKSYPCINRPLFVFGIPKIACRQVEAAGLE